MSRYVFEDSKTFKTYGPLQSKRFMRAPLTLKLCAEVWKTGYECSLNPGNENSKHEMETPEFPPRLISTFTGKVQAFKLKLQTSDQIVYFRF